MSSTGTYQIALIAKQSQKPFYALAESYKFLRHYPLSQTDLPFPKINGKPPPRPLTFPATLTPFRPIVQSSHSYLEPGSVPDSSADSARGEEVGDEQNDASPHVPGTPRNGASSKRLFEMTAEMEDLNPKVDVTTPNLVDFIITDLGSPLTPTSVSQYLVAQFSS